MRRRSKIERVSNVEFLFLPISIHPLDAVVTQLACTVCRTSETGCHGCAASTLRDGGKFCLRDVVFNFDIKDYEDLIESYISRA